MDFYNVIARTILHMAWIYIKSDVVYKVKKLRYGMFLKRNGK